MVKIPRKYFIYSLRHWNVRLYIPFNVIRRCYSHLTVILHILKSHGALQVCALLDIQNTIVFQNACILMDCMWQDIPLGSAGTQKKAVCSFTCESTILLHLYLLTFWGRTDTRTARATHRARSTNWTYSLKKS